MKRNIYFCSFADSKLKNALERIGQEANNFKIFKEILLYTEKELPKETQEKCEKIIEITNNKRGYGYWTWKPIIILEIIINKLDDGDILFYCDAGSHLNCNGINLFKQYIKKAIKNDIWVGQLSSKYNELKYTKADTINQFKDKIKNQNILKTGQIQSGNIILIKNNYTINIINQWKELMKIENLKFYDDSPSKIKNSEKFIENRHDQSILSLLIKTNHAYLENAENFWCPYDLWNFCKIPILNMRDKENKYKAIEYISPIQRIINFIWWNYHKILKN